MNRQSSAVNVFLRIRPLQPFEGNLKSCINVTKTTDKFVAIDNQQFRFDKVFFEGATNEELFGAVVSIA